jgi:hypothetical protein
MGRPGTYQRRCQQCGQRKPANPDKLWRIMCDEDEREKTKEGVS